MGKNIKPINEILRDLVEGGGLPLDPVVPLILEYWPRVVPESLRPFVSLDGLRDGVLVVLVSNPAAGQELQFLKEALRNQINQGLGRTVIQEVRVKMGALPPPDPERKRSVQPLPVTPRTLTRKEKSSISRLTKEIKNSGIREQLQTLMKKSLAFSRPESGEPRGSKRRVVRKPSTEEGP